MKRVIGICVAAMLATVLMALNLRLPRCTRGDPPGTRWGRSEEEKVRLLKELHSTHLSWRIVFPLSKKERANLERAIHSAAWGDVLVPKDIRSMPSNIWFAWSCKPLLPDRTCGGDFTLLGMAYDPKTRGTKCYPFWKCGDNWVLYGSKHG